MMQPFDITSNTVDEAARFAIVTQNQNNSPLLRLPAELRNKIYKYLLRGHTYRINPHIIIPHYVRRFINGSTPLHFPHFPQEDNLDILYVCRQTNAEARLLPYTLITFSFSDNPISDETFSYFILGYSFHHKRTTAQKLAVESLEFRAVVVCSESGMTVRSDAQARADIIPTFTNVKRVHVRIEVCGYREFGDTVGLEQAVQDIRDRYQDVKAGVQVSFEVVHSTVESLHMLKNCRVDGLFMIPSSTVQGGLTSNGP